MRTGFDQCPVIASAGDYLGRKIAGQAGPQTDPLALCLKRGTERVFCKVHQMMAISTIGLFLAMRSKLNGDRSSVR